MAHSKEPHWVAYADLMTLLMVIFLFISVSFMALIDAQSRENRKLFDTYKAAKIDLYHELNNKFNLFVEQWGIELDRDLSIRFKNPEVLFETNKAELRPRFKQILDEFIPMYFDIILQPQYIGYLSEIRIEGHTDDVPETDLKKDESYMFNMKLSQDRSREVLRYIRSTYYYQQLPPSHTQKLIGLLTANGLSFGRPVLYPNGKINPERSRRVEFRLLTGSDQLIEEFLQKQ